MNALLKWKLLFSSALGTTYHALILKSVIVPTSLPNISVTFLSQLQHHSYSSCLDCSCCWYMYFLTTYSESIVLDLQFSLAKASNLFLHDSFLTACVDPASFLPPRVSFTWLIWGHIIWRQCVTLTASHNVLLLLHLTMYYSYCDLQNECYRAVSVLYRFPGLANSHFMVATHIAHLFLSTGPLVPVVLPTRSGTAVLVYHG